MREQLEILNQFTISDLAVLRDESQSTIDILESAVDNMGIDDKFNGMNRDEVLELLEQHTIVRNKIEAPIGIKYMTLFEELNK